VIREVPRIVTRAWHRVSCPVVTIASYLQLMPFAGLLVEVGRPVADRLPALLCPLRNMRKIG
jgi:hypothetical protein